MPPEVIAGLQYVWLALLAILVGAAVHTLLPPSAAAAAAGTGPLSGPAAGLAAMLLPFAVLMRGLAHAKAILGEYEGPMLPALKSYVDYTPQGQALLVMALPAILVAPTVLLLRRAAPPRILALSLLVLALPLAGAQAAQGHAQILGGGSMGLFPMAPEVAKGTFVDALHLCAALVWIGGLFHLATAHLQGAPLSLPVLRRFSNLALGCVVTLIATGLGTYHLHFRSRIIALLSGWGVVLLMKLAALLPMLILALGNRLALRRGETPAAKRLLAELLLGMLALMLGSYLSQLDPHTWE